MLVPGPLGGASGPLGPCLAECPALTALELQQNALGVDGGKAIAGALIECPVKLSLKLLDLSANNLCNLDAAVVGGTRSHGEWTSEALEALCEALLMGLTITELLLYANGLCGLWPEHFCGERSSRGERSKPSRSDTPRPSRWGNAWRRARVGTRFDASTEMSWRCTPDAGRTSVWDRGWRS